MTIARRKTAAPGLATPWWRRRGTSSRPLVAALAAGVLMLAVVVTLLVLQQQGAGPQPEPGGDVVSRETGAAPVNGASKPLLPALTVEQTQALLAERDLALGYLENEKTIDADPLLERLAQQLPEDPWGPQNLLVCRVMALELIDAIRDPDAARAAAEKAEVAATALQKLKPDSLAAHVLISRLANQQGDVARAVRELDAATQVPGADAAVWYELAQRQKLASAAGSAGKAVGDGADQGRDALLRAAELQPDNLFLLPEVALALAEAKRPEAAEVLRRGARLLQPYADLIKTHTRVDAVQLAEAAASAAEASNWPLVLRNARIIGNVVRPEAVAQSDRLRVNKHALEYLQLEFSPATLDRLTAAPLNPQDVPSVAYEAPVELPLSALAQSATGDGPVVESAAFGDVNLDTRLDFVVLGNHGLDTYVRAGGATDATDGTATEPPGTTPAATSPADEWRVAPTLTLEPATFQRGVLLLDLDDDVVLPAAGDPPRTKAHCYEADLDAVLFGPGGLKFLENTTNVLSGTAPSASPPTDAATSANRPLWEARSVGPAVDTLRLVTHVVPIDVEQDGDLDFCVVSDGKLRVLLNRGNWAFDDITDRSQLPGPEVTIQAAATCDFDRDTDPDLILADASGAVSWLENLRYGRFRWGALPAEFKLPAAPQQLFVVEFDGNASWDLLWSAPGGAGVTLTRTVPGAVPTVLRTFASTGDAVANLLTGDFNCDGTLDVVSSHAGQVQLLRGLRPDRWLPSDQLSVPGVPLVAANFSGQGGLDLLTAGRSEGRPFLRWNRAVAAPDRNWIELSLRAQQVKGTDQTASGRVNHYALGSTVEVRAGGTYQATVVSTPVTHFGLGKVPQAEVVRVLWTNGVPRNVIRPARNELICERQTLTGSCPYLYAWNGERFEFVTDLLWAAPLGLKFGEHVVAPWREWEYLKVDGKFLAPREGRYELQITEELWEAAYFDRVSLLAIDHPRDTEVFTNEKVGPPSIAEHRLHFVTDKVRPVAALGAAGASVLKEVAQRDGTYATTYERKLRQGLTTPHYLELEFPPIASEGPVTLFLTGWLYPTNTSINVALSQNEDLPEVEPLSLWVPDAAGTWQLAQPFCGFPGGKTKTIAIDVSANLDRQHPRLRLVSNQELYWDEAFLSVGDQLTPHRVTELTLTSADLHWRGVSHIVQHPTNGPEWYDYARVHRGSVWPPMEGPLTPYGSVKQLLSAQDDQLVVLTTGDEMTVAFEALPPPEEGMIRDFVLHNVGWDKDADPNTVYAHTTLPLPWQAMPVYGGEEEGSATLGAEGRERTASRVRFWRELVAPDWSPQFDTTDPQAETSGAFR